MNAIADKIKAMAYHLNKECHMDTLDLGILAIVQ
jgi:hypothetical protein